MPHIHGMNFRTFDLNLLRVLDAMLVERNATRAGEKLGLSQPAVSSAINRMRDLLGDPLFLREGNAMVPTPFALSLQQPVRAALDALESALSGGRPFDPARANRSFRIYASDYFSEMLMPRLIERVSAIAPNVRLQLIDTSQKSLLGELSANAIDFAIAPHTETPDWVDRTVAFHSSFVAVAARDHQRLARNGITPGEPIPLDLFCDIPHILFSLDGNLSGMGDEALARIGRRRNVVMSVPGFYGVARAVAQSQLIAILPTRFATALAGRLGLSVYRIPLAIPLACLHLYWHRRNSTSAEHLWMRDIILELLQPLDEVAHPFTLH